VSSRIPTPRRLNEGLVRAAARLALQGATRRQVAAGLGVGERTLRDWLALGRERPDSVYGYLRRALQKAEAARSPLPPETPEERERLDELLGPSVGIPTDSVDDDEPSPIPARKPATMPPDVPTPKDFRVDYTDSGGNRQSLPFPPEDLATIIEGLAATGAKDAVVSATVNGRRQSMPVNPVPAGAE
jgi:hypothetical protein